MWPFKSKEITTTANTTADIVKQAPDNNFIYKLALDSMEIFPESYVDSDGNKTVRGEFGSGWNDALQTYAHRIALLVSYILSNNIHTGKLYSLIEMGYINASINDSEHTITFNLLMNDIFAYASSDEEAISHSDIDDLYDLYIRHGFSGIIAFVSSKRNGSLPLLRYITRDYKRACSYYRSVLKERKST